MSRLRHCYSNHQLAALMNCSIATVKRWKAKHGLGRKVWLSDLRRLFPAAYQSARLVSWESGPGFAPEE